MFEISFAVESLPLPRSFPFHQNQTSLVSCVGISRLNEAVPEANS